MINEIKQDGKARMQKALEALDGAFAKLRTGRAHTGILSGVMVSYYGNPTPLNQVASINVEDARTLLVQPFERSMVAAVDKAIREADLGLNPMTADVIRVPMPALTEETRRDMQKIAKSEAESLRVSVRNIRRDMLSDIKELVKDKQLSEDDERRAGDDIQKLTDEFIKTIDERLAKKESELMEV